MAIGNVIRLERGNFCADQGKPDQNCSESRHDDCFKLLSCLVGLVAL